jgi:hypothetical protein
MQGRIGELGREMAKFATSPGILSTMPSRVSAQAVSTLDLYPSPAFLRPPRHLRRLLLLVCRQRVWDSRWWPLRNSLHAQGRRVLARHYVNDTRSH